MTSEEPWLVVMGASLGGITALNILLASLPGDFHLPIVIVVHRSVESDSHLCSALSSASKLPLIEPDDKAIIKKGHIYVAPPDYHLLVDGEGDILSLSTEGPVNFARPSIDVLFESAAVAKRQKLVGVVLTGSSEDGAKGALAIENSGGLVIVQDPQDSEATKMPTTAILVTRSPRILRLSEIGPFLGNISLI